MPFASDCVALQSYPLCEMGFIVLRYGLFHRPIKPISECKRAHIAMRNGPYCNRPSGRPCRGMNLARYCCPFIRLIVRRLWNCAANYRKMPWKSD